MTDAHENELGPVVNIRDDHYCFGCGALNPRGLRLKFRATADGAELHAAFTPEREHEGFTRIVHGGIISALLDEAMAWAIYSRRSWAVTGRMSVSFRRPVEVGVATVVVGRVASDRGRLIDAEGEVRRAADGEVLASATATFVRVPEEQAAEWRARYGVE